MNNPDLSTHHDALMAQWQRSKQLRNLDVLRELAKSKGLQVIRSVGLDQETYRVLPEGEKPKFNTLRLRSLAELGDYLDRYQTPGAKQ